MKRKIEKRYVLIVLGVCVGLFVLAQLIPVGRGNPPESAPIQAPAEVMAVLEAACFDCHSHRTEWPWYGYVAPVSWMLAHHVNHGREYVNFSEWGNLDAKKQFGMKQVIWMEVEEGEMPLAPYTWLHPEARLSDAQRTVLREWTEE